MVQVFGVFVSFLVEAVVVRVGEPRAEQTTVARIAVRHAMGVVLGARLAAVDVCACSFGSGLAYDQRVVV